MEGRGGGGGAIQRGWRFTYILRCQQPDHWLNWVKRAPSPPSPPLSRLRASNAVDFDDMLVLTVQLLKAHPKVLEECRRKWKHVLVDEFQVGAGVGRGMA